MKKILLAALMLLTIATQAQTKARILENIKNEDSTFNLRYEIYIPVPIQFTGIPDKNATLQSFKGQFPEIERIDGNTVVFRLNDKFGNSQTEESIKSFISDRWDAFSGGLNAIQVNASDWILGQTLEGNTWNCNE